MNKSVFFAKLKQGNATKYDNLSVRVFDDILVNRGDAYSPVTGEFVAPTDGIYIFVGTVLFKTGGTLWFKLDQNNSTTMLTKMTGETGRFRERHTMRKGDKVLAKLMGSYNSGYFYVFTIG